MSRPTPSARVVGISHGYRDPNSSTTAATTVTAVARNATPSRCRGIAATATRTPTTAATVTAQVQPLPWASWVHSTKAAPVTAAATATGTISRSVASRR